MVNFIQSELNKEFSAIGFKNQRRHLKTGKQIGRTSKSVDSKRKALLPGKRISKTGNIYYENRANRSDKRGKKI